MNPVFFYWLWWNGFLFDPTIFTWLKNRTSQALIEITVHPHNESGLATCRSICERWGGLAISDYVAIEIGGRTIPHILHLVQLDRGDTE